MTGTVWLDKRGRTIRTTGYGKVWKGAPDLAEKRLELARERNQAIDLAATVTAPPEGEIGSPFGRYRMFSYYQDGMLFESGPIETAEVEQMIAADGHARSIEQVLTLPLRGAPFSLKPAKGDAGELDFVTDALTRAPEMGGMTVPLNTVLGQMTSACLFKRAHFEKVFEVSEVDGKVRYKKLAYRPPSTCYLARNASDGSFAGFMQWSWLGMQFERIMIPANKAFVFIHGTHRNPLEGISDLDVAYTIWQSKQKLRFLWYQFLECQAAPRTVAQVGTSNEGEASALAAKIGRLRGGGVAGILQGQTVQVLESNGSGASEFQQAITYLDSEGYQSVLAGFMNMTTMSRSSGGSSGGSSGASTGGRGMGAGGMMQAATQFFYASRQAVLKEMAAAFNTYVIADLVRYNFGPDAAVPQLTYGELAQSDAGQQAVQLLQAIAAAATPTPLLPLEFIDQLVIKTATMLDLNVDSITTALQEMTAKRGSALTPADEAVQAGMMTPEQGQVHNTLDGLTQLTLQRQAAGLAPVALKPGGPSAT